MFSLLRLNINRDKTGVARQKILNSSDSTNIQVLVGMSAPVLPCAIEWISRDRIGLSLMYSVVRGIPTLFEPKILYDNSGRKRCRNPPRRLVVVVSCDKLPSFFA